MDGHWWQNGPDGVRRRPRCVCCATRKYLVASFPLNLNDSSLAPPLPPLRLLSSQTSSRCLPRMAVTVCSALIQLPRALGPRPRLVRLALWCPATIATALTRTSSSQWHSLSMKRSLNSKCTAGVAKITGTHRRHQGQNQSRNNGTLRSPGFDAPDKNAKSVLIS